MLKLENVSVWHDKGTEPVLRDITFSIAEGERVALVGLNGSGKTTLLHSIVGLLPHSGKIEVEKLEVKPANYAATRNKIGFLFNIPEDQLLFPTVLDDVAYGLLRRGIPANAAREKALATLRDLDLSGLAAKSVHALSHGQRLRVALAGCLVTSPQLLLLDEPTAGLDPLGVRQLTRILHGEKSAALITTHDLTFARLCCTRFLHLQNGLLVKDSKDMESLPQLWENQTG